MTDKRILLTTCGKAEDAERIARTLVERRLAACVNIVPGVRSFYRWEGRVEGDAELLLIVKTAAQFVEDLKTALTEIHPYDLPECVVLSIDDGSAGYLAWIADSVGV